MNELGERGRGRRKAGGDGVAGKRALVLTGSLGLGHHVITEVVADSLRRLGWRTDVLDCMSLLGRYESQIGDWVFRRITAVPTLYDGIHFSHLRTGSRLASTLDREATKRLVPALRMELEREPADLLVSAFATGASAIAKLADEGAVGRPSTVALCTDVTPHRMWVWEGLDVFLVTSSAAAAAVRRYVPRAPIAVVPPPVRPAFFAAPSQEDARRALGLDPSARCTLVMGGGWGLGPLAETARALARQGVTVLAVAGRNRRLADTLREVGRLEDRVVPYGFTDEVPTLMAASDLIITTPGATTCSEARVVGRPLMLLDVIPGHGRDNIQHELEMGHADVCDPEPGRLVESVVAALERSAPPGPSPHPTDHFGERFAESLAVVGIVASENAQESPTRSATTGPLGARQEVY